MRKGRGSMAVERTAYIVLFALLPWPAFAYLDPGTGSLLVYAIVGIASTVFFAVRNLWYGFKGRILLTGKSVSEKLPDVVFHSEGGQYWHVFEPVIAELERLGVACAYVTPDRADPGLGREGRGYTGLRPGTADATIAWMNSARCKLVVSTTPHLDVYMLRRSKGVGSYAHLFHAPTDLAFYEKYAFDWYDALLTVGPFQDASVRALEAKRGTPVKELLPTGCTYFDSMVTELAATGAGLERDGRTILYAPTWGVRSSVLKYGAGIIDSLTGSGYRVIFRPHPQFYVSHREEIAALELALAENPLVELDRRRTGMASMARSDLLVTDLSGILFDYALLYERPILLAMSDASVGGQEGEDMPVPLWDIEASKALSAALVGDALDELPRVAANVISQAPRQAERIRAFRDAEFHNFGKAGPAAADNILALLDGR